MSFDLATAVVDARRRTCELVADLSDEQLRVPLLPIINPFLWEIGHVAWFQEKWVLRHAGGRPPLDGAADALYDSMAVAHDTRWNLALPSRQSILDYLQRVRDLVLDRLAQGDLTAEEEYFVRLATFHEDMHGEAFLYTRQTLAYPAPELSGTAAPTAEAGPWPGDVRVAGGRFVLGAEPGAEPFVFDNEKWGHGVEVQPFAIARAAVTAGEFAAFVEAGAYAEPNLWGPAGWAWRQAAAAEHPLYWRRGADGWERRRFDRWEPLRPHQPVMHVSWYEAEAYCRWAGRRLPTEAEWELAAAGTPKRRFPWGDEAADGSQARLDAAGLAPADVGAYPAGDSAAGCRQMLGNTWEWTADDFGPFPGFVVDPYKEYSVPWFGDHKVLRGGCWVTRGRMLRNTWRNFYRPDRRDVWSGFRTCALQP